jgi:O-methyltransferase involved in polyketide biosynthesis
VEVDFPEVVLNKASAIRKRKKLSNLLKDPQYLGSWSSHTRAPSPRTTMALRPTVRCSASGDIVSKHYILLGGDLRDITAIEKKLTSLTSSTFDFAKPTLFLSECVLIYLTVDQACQVIQWASSKFTNSAILIYEQILPHDNFGKTMVKNLQVRLVASLLRGPIKYPPHHN